MDSTAAYKRQNRQQGDAIAAVVKLPEAQKQDDQGQQEGNTSLVPHTADNKSGVDSKGEDKNDHTAKLDTAVADKKSGAHSDGDEKNDYTAKLDTAVTTLAHSIAPIIREHRDLMDEREAALREKLHRFESAEIASQATIRILNSMLQRSREAAETSEKALQQHNQGLKLWKAKVWQLQSEAKSANERIQELEDLLSETLTTKSKDIDELSMRLNQLKEDGKASEDQERRLKIKDAEVEGRVKRMNERLKETERERDQANACAREAEGEFRALKAKIAALETRNQHLTTQMTALADSVTQTASCKHCDAPFKCWVEARGTVNNPAWRLRCGECGERH